MSIQNYLTNNDNLLVRDKDRHKESSNEQSKRSFFFAKDRKKKNKAGEIDRSELLYVSSKGYFFQ